VNPTLHLGDTQVDGRSLAEVRHEPSLLKAQDLPPEALARGLAYAGFVLVGYELVKDMIVGPIKLFYRDATFGQGMPFKTYDEDGRARHKNEFKLSNYRTRMEIGADPGFGSNYRLPTTFRFTAISFPIRAAPRRGRRIGDLQAVSESRQLVPRGADSL
jgi:hypothetical protein